MVRRDLTLKEVEQMGRQEPGSAARYLEERRAEIEAEEQKRREEDDKQRWIAAFISAGGSRKDGEAVYKAQQNERAADTVRKQNEVAVLAHRRHITREVL
jgi:hypothetical protein